jgi:hypothetical protein
MDKPFAKKNVTPERENYIHGTMWVFSIAPRKHARKWLKKNQ